MVFSCYLPKRRARIKDSELPPYDISHPRDHVPRLTRSLLSHLHRPPHPATTTAVGNRGTARGCGGGCGGGDGWIARSIFARLFEEEVGEAQEDSRIRLRTPAHGVAPAEVKSN